MELLLQTWHKPRAARHDHMKFHRHRQPPFIWNTVNVLRDVITDVANPKLREWKLMPARVRNLFRLGFRPGDRLVLRPIMLDKLFGERVSSFRESGRRMKVV